MIVTCFYFAVNRTDVFFLRIMHVPVTHTIVRISGILDIVYALNPYILNDFVNVNIKIL